MPVIKVGSLLENVVLDCFAVQQLRFVRDQIQQKIVVEKDSGVDIMDKNVAKACLAAPNVGFVRKGYHHLI